MADLPVVRIMGEVFDLDAIDAIEEIKAGTSGGVLHVITKCGDHDFINCGDRASAVYIAFQVNKLIK